MIGGGIFAILGITVKLSRGGTPISFLFAGIIALFTSYSYAKLSSRFYTETEGTIGYYKKAFGKSLLTGVLNILLWISYIVMISLYAYAFGVYGASLFPSNLQTVLKHVFISSSLLIFTVLNLFGTESMTKIEKYIVGIQLAILLIFIGVGSFSINTSQILSFENVSPFKFFAGGMVVFLAYEGFQLIANTSRKIKNPKRI